MKNFDYVARLNSNNNYVLFRHYVNNGLLHKFKHKDIAVEDENVVLEYNLVPVRSSGCFESHNPIGSRPLYGKAVSLEYLIFQNTDIVGIHDYAELLNFIRSCSESDFLQVIEDINNNLKTQSDLNIPQNQEF